MSKKNLVIVESPTKARTISRFLGAGFDVTSSMGHIRDLPKSKLGVNTENNFEPKYVIPDKAKSLVSELKKKAKNADDIILATDEDREGEAIAWHLAQALGIKNDEIKRIVFHEITKPAIQAALASPRKLDMNLVNAQQARRVLDRLVGYELSPFLWKKVMRGLSAGRVQSVAVRLIVEREREIQKFQPEEYWNILANLRQVASKGTPAFKARLNKIDGKPVKKFDIKGEQQAKDILEQLKGADYQVTDIQTKETRRSPAAPFTTSTLQQDCARKLGFTARQTMMIAQQLYEGVDIGEEGSTGLITYMRTDSVNLAEVALEQAEAVIKEKYGPEYALAEPRRYKTKSKGAQEAHEAIRPTDIARLPESVSQYLDARQFKVYDLIWKRAVASQMKEAIFDQTAVDIAAKNFTFRATGQVVKFDGFMRAYEILKEEKKDDEEKEEYEEGLLPKLERDERLDLIELNSKQSFTEPPPRYNDASLIKTLEEAGIGRPSTYAPIITTIQARKYVERKENRFHPTDIGMVVNDILVEHFPEIVDIDFTAKMEGGLDEIAEGQRQWQPMVSEFYRPFKEHLEQKNESVEKHIEISTTPCPHCGKMMMIKFGRFGKFLACPDPESKVTLPLPEEAALLAQLKEKTKDEKCSLCGGPMEVKRGRFGYFLGCARYPECKGISRIWNKTGFKCPNCLATPERANNPGDIVEKKSRGRGKAFYACTRYPDCTFIMNKKPENEDEVKAALEHWKANPPKPKPEKKKYPEKKKSE